MARAMRLPPGGTAFMMRRIPQGSHCLALIWQCAGPQMAGLALARDAEQLLDWV